jgi:hypothetical protein
MKCIVVLLACGILFAQSSPPSSTPTVSSDQKQQSFEGNAVVLTDTMGVDFNLYLRRVLHDVKQNWYAILGPSPVTKKGKVVIEFFILKDGSVAGLKAVHSSGDAALVRSAFGSITASNPFNPLPKEFPGPSLGLRFSYVCNPTVSILPGLVQVPIGASQQFSATVNTTGDATVNWSISGKGCAGAGCGTVSATGLYTAPATLPDPPSVTVTATLASDPAETATAAVEIAKHEEKPSGESDAAPQKQR